MLSKSIEERAISLMIQGVDAIEAVKLAIIEESKLNTLNDINLKYAAIEQANKDKQAIDEEAAKQKADKA